MFQRQAYTPFVLDRPSSRSFISAASVLALLVLLVGPGCGEGEGGTIEPTIGEDPTELYILTGKSGSLIKEQEIGQPGVKYMDPEFHQDTFQVAFYIGLDEVYLGQMDAQTGRFADFNYQHISKAAPIITTFNGPEFGESQSGTSIYFTGVDNTYHLHTFRYRDNQLVQLDSGTPNILANYPSQNPADPFALVMGVALQKPTNTHQDGNVPWAVFSEDRPDQIRTFKMAVIGKGARFVPGQRRVTTNLRDAEGFIQVALYDFDQDQTAQITFDGDNKDSAVMFSAPELGGELLLFAVVNSGTSIRVYREIERRWQPYKELKAPLGTLYQNPQALSFKGRTFFTVNTKTEVSNNSDILLLSLKTGLSLKVSGSASMKRFDPETLVSGEHLFFYYYDLSSGRLFMSDLVLTDSIN